MNAPFFSIIVPAYNARETLEECLNSIWAQSFSDYELILINDGSEDRTAAIAEEWAADKTGLNFKLINQVNEGLGAARNAGIANAQGIFCALLDADDLWHETKLESCHNYLQQNKDTTILYHAVENFGPLGNNPRNTFPISRLEDLIRLGCPLVPSASIINKDKALQFPFQTKEEFHGAEDLYLWIELLSAEEEFIYWPEALSYYREDGGMSSRIEDHLQKVNSVYEHFYRGNILSKQQFERATQRKYYEAARFYQKRGKHHQAHHYYSIADSKSLKILGLRILNALGITI